MLGHPYRIPATQTLAPSPLCPDNPPFPAATVPNHAPMNAELSPDSRKPPAAEALPGLHTPMMQVCVLLYISICYVLNLQIHTFLATLNLRKSSDTLHFAPQAGGGAVALITRLTDTRTTANQQ